uniref:RNase H type-1 domain-containing protein n=1 Tax=Cannabis sativa TaxID=3483 RepID=A0A803PS84_CANSA
MKKFKSSSTLDRVRGQLSVLANVVVVQKKEWKVEDYNDFTDLNKACPKGSFLLPHINMLVDATSGHELLSFIDDFFGILHKPEILRRPTKWVVELSEYDITFQTKDNYEILDGSSNNRGCGLGIVLNSPQGDVIQRAIKCDFKAKDSKMVTYLQAVKERLLSFTKISINQVPRIKNSHANALANPGSTIQAKSGVLVPIVYMQWLTVWKPQEEVKDVSKNISWMTPISQYLVDGTLPQDRSQSQKIRTKVARFTLYGSMLYKRSYSKSLLSVLIQ